MPSQTPTSFRTLIFAALALCLALATPAGAQKAQSLSELLRKVQQGWSQERAENRKREQEFRQKRNEQANLLAQAKRQLAAAERKSEELEKAFQENETKIAESEDRLRDRLGNLGELFGVVRQVSGDTRGHVESSLTTAQLGNQRIAFLEELGKATNLPDIDALEQLWYVLLEEMKASGEVTRFQAPVVTAEGEEEPKEVVRIGVFNAVADGEYLQWLSETQQLAVLTPQPPSRYGDTADAILSPNGNERVAFAVDPARGAVLAALVQTPDFEERIDQGGWIGRAIIILGGITVLIGLVLLVRVLLISRRVASQRKSSEPRGNNPLGRILQVYEANKNVDTETLELKLDEAILRESGSVNRFIWAIKVVSVVAPLMGLLGTVTGMIRTFQTIVLFGTGDPKLMAGGISEALVTTMLGLLAAIPLVLLHSIVASSAQSVVETIEEQSAGIIARRAEREQEGTVA